MMFFCILKKNNTNDIYTKYQLFMQFIFVYLQ